MRHINFVLGAKNFVFWVRADLFFHADFGKEFPELDGEEKQVRKRGWPAKGAKRKKTRENRSGGQKAYVEEVHVLSLSLSMHRRVDFWSNF